MIYHGTMEGQGREIAVSSFSCRLGKALGILCGRGEKHSILKMHKTEVYLIVPVLGPHVFLPDDCEDVYIFQERLYNFGCATESQRVGIGEENALELSVRPSCTG